MSFPSQTHYRTLNVSQNAKLQEITNAYLALKQKCQAELSPNADATRFLNAIDTAYAVLSDPSQRAKYDQALHTQDAGYPASNQSTSATRQAPPTHIRAGSIASQIASNTPAETQAETKNHGGIRWLGLASLGLALIAGMLWYVFADQIASRDESMSEAQAEVSVTDSADSAMSPASTADSARGTGETKAPTSNDVTELTALAYDPAPIEQFVGSWKGLGETGSQKALEISLKSGSSLVFSLKTKAGNNIGDIVGVAEFDNGSARFFNEEYGCKLFFTRSAEILNVTTGGCQAYHQQGAEFDGSYAKPLAPKPASTKTAAKNTETKNIAVARNVTLPQVAAVREKPPAANPGKLYRYVATVKDASGKTSRIELVAADEKAARAILRDFRGNPDVVRIRRAWF
jgi:curved DNA-binding protein CbpA